MDSLFSGNILCDAAQGAADLCCRGVCMLKFNLLSTRTSRSCSRRFYFHLFSLHGVLVPSAQFSRLSNSLRTAAALPAVSATLQFYIILQIMHAVPALRSLGLYYSIYPRGISTVSALGHSTAGCHAADHKPVLLSEAVLNALLKSR